MGAANVENCIRNAVLASLKNDKKVASPSDASIDDTTVDIKEGEQTDSKPEAELQPLTKQNQSQKKGKKATNLDSNWKALQKVIQKPKRTSQHKFNVKGKLIRQTSENLNNRESSAAAATSTTSSGGNQHEDKEMEDAKHNPSYSAFMPRAVRRNADVTPIVALDCEMVGVGPEGRQDELARVSVVNYTGDVLYDTFVRPREPVTDYRTKFSGVRESDIGLNSAAVDSFEAQRVVGELLNGRIVVGHALKNDFRVLRIAHPGQKVRDTSDYYRKLWNRRSTHKPALKTLVAQVLGVDTFQKNEHDSCEDARAALALYKHNSKDWERRIREGGGVLRKRFDKKSTAKKSNN